MNVFDNLAFPLVCRSWEAGRIKQRVNEVAEILGISDKLNRSAWRLGVDEKQLVSLGRGLVRDDVALLLMDEPLTVIDPQLKFMLRKRIKQANEVLKSTIVYVTHDQYEAMTFADELLVMSDGAVVQQGTPEQLFERPKDSYVGYFIGSPAMNFLAAQASGGRILIEGVEIPVASVNVPDGPVQIGIRPEYVGVSVSSAAPSATVRAVLDQGTTKVATVSLGNQTLKMKVERETPLEIGHQVNLDLPNAKCLVYINGHLLKS
jgi:glycerol transport system ATP-binding protein